MKRKKRKTTPKTEMRAISIQSIKDKKIVTVEYKHTTSIHEFNPNRKTNESRDVTNRTLLDYIRIPRLTPLMANGVRNNVATLQFMEAKDISKYVFHVDWRQASALKGWITKRQKNKNQSNKPNENTTNRQ